MVVESLLLKIDEAEIIEEHVGAWLTAQKHDN